MTAVCKTCGPYAFIRREILSTQNSSCGLAYLERVKAYVSVFEAYTKLVYNDLDVCPYVELCVEKYAGVRVTGPLQSSR